VYFSVTLTISCAIADFSSKGSVVNGRQLMKINAAGIRCR
jgi:hypothetical protein